MVRAAVQDAVTSQVDAADANRLAHSQLISVLNGDNALVTATGGEVVLNLLPLVNDVLHTVSGPLSAMTGGAVSLPPVTAIPAAACHAITGTVSSRISGCLLLLHRKATNSSSATSKALTLPEYRYRLRVGDYRVLYEVIDGQLIILVVGVGHRRESTG